VLRSRRRTVWHAPVTCDLCLVARLRTSVRRTRPRPFSHLITAANPGTNSPSLARPQLREECRLEMAKLLLDRLPLKRYGDDLS